MVFTLTQLVVVGIVCFVLGMWHMSSRHEAKEVRREYESSLRELKYENLELECKVHRYESQNKEE